MSGVVVVAGATGFVGSHAVRALREAGYTVRGGTRSPERARAAEPEIDWVHLDVADEASMAAALAGADALVYLVHQMREHADNLLQSERDSALRVRTAAEVAGVRRVVYLGGPDPGRDASEHLAARLETGRVLRAGKVSTIELQASMIIGAGSESWLIVRDLAFRLPVMVLPKWLERRSQPIGIADVAQAITRSISLEVEGSACLPLPGPEVLSAKDIMLRVAGMHDRRPLMIPIPVLTPSLSSHWIRLVTRADYGIARQLVDGLTGDLIAGPDDFWSRCADISPTPLHRVMQDALDDEPPLPGSQRVWERVVRSLSLPSREHAPG